MKLVNSIVLLLFVSYFSLTSLKAVDTPTPSTPKDSRKLLEDLKKSLITPKNKVNTTEITKDSLHNEITKYVDSDYGFLKEFKTDDGSIVNISQNNTDNFVIIYTDGGENIILQLVPTLAPKTVIAFRKLVRKGFYNDTAFFKLIPNYIVQAGDPTDSGYGGSGQKRTAELSAEIFKRGTVAMSNEGDLVSDDSQFFITFNSFSWLNQKYTIFAKVIAGMDFLESLSGEFANNGILKDPIIIDKMMVATDVINANKIKKLPASVAPSVTATAAPTTTAPAPTTTAAAAPATTAAPSSAATPTSTPRNTRDNRKYGIDIAPKSSDKEDDKIIVPPVGSTSDRSSSTIYGNLK